ncbi:hypothetical protein DBR28_18325, partial [Chryseobacterium sp. HMWF028]
SKHKVSKALTKKNIKMQETDEYFVITFTLTLHFSLYFYGRSYSCYPLILLAPSLSSSRSKNPASCCGVTASIRAKTIIESKAKQSLESFLHPIKINLTGFKNLLGLTR